MKHYYICINKNPFKNIPLTFHISTGLNDPEYIAFEQYFYKNKASKNKKSNIWIIKPGEFTNCGTGIQVSSNLKEIQAIVSKTMFRTFIVQRYLDKPMLFKTRKFDIRCYILITLINNTLKGYWYKDGYVRTSSMKFSLNDLNNKFVHLTNDSIQK